MKKFCFFASMLLTSAALMNSCGEKDIPVVEQKTVIELDGQKYETDLVASLVGEVGTEVSLSLGVYDRFDIYGVDFGDGNIVADTVCFENGGLRDENGAEVEGTTHKSTTKFTGTVAGDGTIKIYGKSDIWMLDASGNAVPTSCNQEKFKNVQYLQLTGANIESFDATGLDKLTSLYIHNSPVSAVNVSKNPELKNLGILCTSVSKYEPQLKSIDVSNNPKLEYLGLGSSFYLHGQLTSVDLSKNQEIQTIVIGNNNLKSIVLPEGAKISQLSLEMNELETLDLSMLESLKNIQVNDNKLKTLDLSKMVEASSINVNVSNNQLEELTVPVVVRTLEAQNNQLKKVSVVDATYSCKLENNQLTLETLPTKPASLNTNAKTKRFTYAPQAPLAVPEEVTELDLTSQLTAQGILEAPVTTVYSFVTATGTVLAEGTDYEVVAPGKFKFTKAQSEKVYGVMANEGFPLFTGDNAFKTTEFTVKAEAQSAETVIFSWEAGVATGGTVVGNGVDADKVTESYFAVSSKKANIEEDNITISFNKALAAGDIIKITGYRKKDTDANGTLYFLFENGAVIDEGDEVKWNNIHENVGQEPNTNTYEVTDGAGSKFIKLARSKASTNVYITKFEIIRK